MGLFDEAKGVLRSAGKKIATKTGEYSRIARLTLDIKKCENEIENNLVEIGKHVINLVDKGSASLDLNDSKITGYNNKIKELENKIQTDRAEIEKLKKSDVAVS